MSEKVSPKTAGKEKFLGVGFQWPLTLDQGGGVALSRAEKDIAQSVRLILATRRGERRMRPEFGCRIHDYVFAPNNARTHTQLVEAVVEALTLFERRIEEIEADVVPDEMELDKVYVNVRYRVRTVNSEHNLVYPFYLQGS